MSSSHRGALRRGTAASRRRQTSRRKPTRRPGIYEEAERDYLAFWAAWARKLEWMKPFTKTLEWNEPFAKWFADGELNVSVNCLDRHVQRREAATRSPTIIEGEPGDRWTITYSELLDDVCQLCERSAQARHQEGRSRRDLHADDPRAAGRDAGMRAHRRGALGDLRRLLARLDRRPRQRLGVRRDHHRRLRLAPRAEGPAQTQLRHRDGADAFDRALHRRQSRRRRGLHARRPRHLVGRADRRQIAARASPSA